MREIFGKKVEVIADKKNAYQSFCSFIYDKKNTPNS